MNRTLRILNVEDQERDVALLKRHLSLAGYKLIPERVETAEAMRAALESQDWDVILCDYSMPQFNALSALAVLKETGLDIPFIIISGTVGEEVAVEAMRAGAHDYLMKDNLVRLAPTIERELHEAENRRARKRAEDSLKASEAEMRALFAAITDPIFVLDAGGRCLRIAPTAPTYLYKPSAELIGKRLHESFPKEQADLFLGHIRQALEIGRMQRLEYSLQIEGTEMWFDGSVSPMSKEMVVWIARDITERKRAEDKLRRQALVFETIYDGVLLMDLDSRIIDWNVAAERIFGYSKEEMLGESPERFHHPSLQGALEREIRKTVALKGRWAGELPFLRKDGVEGVADVIIVMQRDTQGNPISLVGVNRDITERKRAEQELSKSQERYRDTVENARDIIYTHDLEGNYTSVNKAGEQIIGYSREEACKLNLMQTVAPEYLEKARQSLARKLAGEEETIYDMEIIAKDGHRVAVEVNTRLVYQDGVPVGVQGIARDVTERKQLEEQLRQSQKMEAIGKLAGGIAHDFNNLLTAITGYSELTMRRLQREDPLRHNIEEIKKAGDRAATLTRQLLAFSRKQVLQPKVLDLNSIVADIADIDKMLGRLIGEDIELRTVLGSALGSIKADPGQLEQVIMNLAVNARDAMPQGGKLTIETENVNLDEEYAMQHIAIRPGPYVMLAVSDTGTGIDQKTQARIFEPFFTTKEAGKGTGLGLSTVYGIVKQSGGNIWVYSEAGKGTTFKVYLPRVDEGAEQYKRSAQTEEAVQGSETILLVEDEEMVRKLARQVLEMYGYRVLEAAGGGEALLICERHREQIHLLVTDVIMPEMSGRELVDRLAELRPEMRVLYMSGYTDESIVHHGILDADTPFIEKPFAPDALAHKVREVLDKN